MRAFHHCLVFIMPAMYVSVATAQSPAVKLQAGLGYARAFDGGGISLTAAVERPLSAQTSKVQHGLGGGLWYARTDVRSNPGQREILGLGMRYQLELGPTARGAKLFLAVPVEVLLSHVPDFAALQGASALASAVPEPGPPAPIENRVGSEWGWGAGLELGVRGRVAQRLSAYTSVQGLYQDIYGAGARGTVWNWHAGITFGMGSR
jgi:hypothetical protein